MSGNPEQRTLIDWDALADTPIQEIAERFGVTRVTINRWMRADGVPKRTPDTWSHGLSGYNHKGCRCLVCTQAMQEYGKRARDTERRRTAIRRALVAHGVRITQDLVNDLLGIE
jgi:hypothetical protein